jgi:hypothetical protein
MVQCKKCGDEVPDGKRRCDSCGKLVVLYLPEPLFLMTSLSFAAAYGLIGFFGIGHLYIGKDRKGAVLFVFGVALLTFFLLNISERPEILLWVTILGIIVWVFSVLDVYRLTKRYNKHLAINGAAPW